MRTAGQKAAAMSHAVRMIVAVGPFYAMLSAIASCIGAMGRVRR